VGVTGGPGVKLNIFRALAAWLNPDEAVVPESEVFPPDQSAKQSQQQDTQEMTSSQQLATAAALTELHIPYATEVTVVQAVSGYPADGVLKAGDVITAVDGKTVTGPSSLTGLIYAHPAGSTLALTIDRNGTTRQVRVGTKESGGHPVMGVEIQEQYKFPFTVTISVGGIGGPSAGMMFALGIIDKLTKLDLTGGKFIAGTGEITASGQVQAIGGIQQKMVGARDAGATYFLTPASNCSDTTGAVPAGLRLVKVSTLTQAVDYLEDIKAGKSVPAC
jgi:PDZ domain-containing protein